MCLGVEVFLLKVPKSPLGLLYELELIVNDDCIPIGKILFFILNITISDGLSTRFSGFKLTDWCALLQARSHRGVV